MFVKHTCWVVPLGSSSGPSSVDDRSMYDGPIKTKHWPIVCPVAPSSFSYTYPQRSAWIDLADWLRTKMVYMPTDGHPSNDPSTNPAVPRCMTGGQTRNLLITSLDTDYQACSSSAALVVDRFDVVLMSWDISQHIWSLHASVICSLMHAYSCSSLMF